MEKTLRENLYDLRSMQICSITLSCLEGNSLSRGLWEITLCPTHSGEQFRFAQLDWAGRSGSGIYFQSVGEAEMYAREIIRDLFLAEARHAHLGFGRDPNLYDWHGRGGLLEVV